MTLEYEISTAQGASYTKLSVKGGCSRGGRRGDIQGFSDASKKRLLDQFHKIPKDYRAKALFITLTYPREYSPDWERWKRDLDVFLKRLVRRYPRCTVLWKIELQKRGAPHYHMIVWGVPFIPFEWVARSWYEIVGSNDPKHLLAGTEVKRVKGDKGAVYYLCKYISKIDSGTSAVRLGRLWGFRGKCFLPVAISYYRVNALVFYEVRRVLRAWIEHKLKKRIRWGTIAGQGITAYLDDCTLNRLVLLAAEKVGTII